MSGICGAWFRSGSGRASNTVATITGALSLGPLETAGQAAEDEAAVGVCARFSTQRIHRGARVAVACDAELYNDDELAQLLGSGEGRIAESGPAGLIAALYERFGDDFIGKLRGSFSIIVWDRTHRKMLAAVDRFGINRLAYFDDEEKLLIGSRVDALARSGEFDTTVNPRAIANVINFSAVLGPETVFAKVHRIPPGCMLLASGRQVRIQRYWDMQYGAESESNERILAEELKSLVSKSVAAHCKRNSFDELGAFLSGGTDSSTVVGLMSSMDTGPVKAFSIGFDEHAFNELEYADIAAKRFGARHYKYLVGPDDCFEALPKMVRSFDEPFGNSSAIPTYFCARLAAQNGVKALLAGDGGDELFGGNERYRTEKIFDLYHGIPTRFRTGVIEPVLAHLPPKAGLIRKARGYVRRANMPGVERMLSFQFLSTHPGAEVFAPEFLTSVNGYSVLDTPSQYYSQASARNHLDRVLYMDVKITLGDSDLPKVTCMSELAGIQTRFPFLDQAVAEFSGRVPARLKVKGLQKRYLFKRAFRNLLPVEIIKKKKHGFGIPVANWLKSDRRFRELLHDTLLSRRAVQRGYFRQNFIQELFRRHAADESSYYGDTLWTFLAVELWHRQCLDQLVVAVDSAGPSVVI